MKELDELARAHHAFGPSDNAFQRRARILQSLWRQEMGYPIGSHRGRLLGSRLAMPFAEETLTNYITDAARCAVRLELARAAKAGKLFGYPRIYNDLLSSQPLCFNLFAPLQADLDLATHVLRDLSDERIHRVTKIEFEHSPGRGDSRYTGDHSAFDVFVQFSTPDGSKGFVGVEVKYHEDMKGRVARLRPRYDAVAGAMDCFRPEAADELRKQPLQQIWRDHLLAGSLLLADGYQDGFFALVAPKDNKACSAVSARYRASLCDDQTFRAWTLEAILTAVERHTDAAWPAAFRRRYLDFARGDLPVNR